MEGAADEPCARAGGAFWGQNNAMARPALERNFCLYRYVHTHKGTNPVRRFVFSYFYAQLLAESNSVALV
jgi:hypothetical protein